MKIQEYAEQEGEKLFNYIKNNDTKNAFVSYERYFFYYRFYLNEWKTNYKKGFLKFIKKEHEKELFSNLFDLETPVKKHHIDFSENIIKHNRIPALFDPFNLNFQNTVDDIFYFKDYIMSIHLYNLIYFFTNKVGSKSNNFYNLINEINDHSLTQKIFTIKNGTHFHIPINKGPVFLFWHKNKMTAIDVSLSNFFEKEFFNLHFFLMSKIDHNSPRKIQEKFINIHKKRNKSIIANSEQKNLADIVKNENDFSHFIGNISPNLFHHSKPENQIISQLLNVEKNFSYGYYIGESFFENYIKNLYPTFSDSFSFEYFYNTRKEIMKNSFKSIFYKDLFHYFFYKYPIIEEKHFDSFIDNIIRKIHFLMHNFNHELHHSFFYQFGFQNSNEISTFINNLYIDYNENDLKVEHLKNKEHKAILNRFLDHL